MPRRMILTDVERQNFLALPTDDDTLIRHWALMTMIAVLLKLDDTMIPDWDWPFSSAHCVILAV